MNNPLKNGEALENPTVTVIMCVYNAAPYLKESIDSILGQTWTDFEFLMINDGSSDGSWEIMAGYTDPRIQQINNETHQGLTYCHKKSLALARGTYIAIQDADDIALPQRLAEEVALLDAEPDVGLVGSGWQFIDAEGNPCALFGNTVIQPSTDPVALQWDLLFYCAIGHPTVMYRRALALSIGGYRDYHAYGEDYDFFYRMSRVTLIKTVPHILEQYRITPAGVTQSLTNEEKVAHCVTLTQANLSDYLNEPLDYSLVELLRLHGFTSGTTPFIYDCTPDDLSLVRQAILFYIRLYRRFTRETHPSPEALKHIQRDFAQEVTRLLGKLSFSARIAFLAQQQRHMPLFIYGNLHFGLSMFLTKGQIAGLSALKQHLLGNKPHVP